MPLSFGGNENLSSQELEQLENGFRILAKLIARAYKKEMSITTGEPNSLNAKLDIPELLSTSDGKLTLTPKEVAKALGVSNNTVYDAIRRGQVPVVKWGRKILVPKVALPKMLAEAKPYIG